MELSAEVLGRLTGAAGLRMEPSRKERRAAGRIPLSVRAMLRRVAPGASRASECIIQVREISSRGASFLYSAVLAFNEPITLEIPTIQGGSITLGCQVKRCERLDSLYRIGAAFTEVVLETSVASKRSSASSRPVRKQ